MVMKQVQVHQVRVQDQLQYSSIRCPRCDSENTKFCYYNNYSLSQPRHFCKACKRYWTRGGTLRSVPVGGGSRKNKRNKRAKVGVGVGVTATSTRKRDVNGMFYGLEIKNQTESGLSFQRELSTSCNGYGIDQSLYNGFLPLGIESSSAREIHEVMNLNTNFASFSGFESSFIDSSLEQQPLIMLDGLNESVTTSNDQAMFPFNDFADLIPAVKEVKIEQGSDLMGNKLDLGAPCIEPMFSLDSAVNWSMIWPDLSNYASSITSLI